DLNASARLLAELLLDSAAYVETIADDDAEARKTALDQFQETIRQREGLFVRQLLDLHRFRPADYAANDLPLEEGKWGVDLFSPAALKQFSIAAGGGAAAGAMAGLTLDALLGGLSLGTGTLIGAATGAVLGAGRTHGKRLVRRVQGATELRCDDTTLLLLQARGLALNAALLRRGHAAVRPIEPKPRREQATDRKRWSRLFDEARQHPRWTRAIGRAGTGAIDPRRQSIAQEMSDLLGGPLTSL
ncbi:MAG: DUF3482 domain-containing protein, partial [Phycisphaerales bacterium JB038]